MSFPVFTPVWRRYIHAATQTSPHGRPLVLSNSFMLYSCLVLLFWMTCNTLYWQFTASGLAGWHCKPLHIVHISCVQTGFAMTTVVAWVQVRCDAC